ncbi:10946_t:CDS:2, partial [Acaulospora morrowiae]
CWEWINGDVIIYELPSEPHEIGIGAITTMILNQTSAAAFTNARLGDNLFRPAKPEVDIPTGLIKRRGIIASWIEELASSDISSNTHTYLSESKLSDNKEIDEFPDFKSKEKVNSEIKQCNRKKKLRNQGLSLVRYKKKETDKLWQELFNTSLESSSQDHFISKNIKPGQIEISERTCIVL